VPNIWLIIHGEAFKDLTFASSLHAVWTTGGRKNEIVRFSFKSRDLSAATPCGGSYKLHS
jgi:hypothetical protein